MDSIHTPPPPRAPQSTDAAVSGKTNLDPSDVALVIQAKDVQKQREEVSASAAILNGLQGQLLAAASSLEANPSDGLTLVKATSVDDEAQKEVDSYKRHWVAKTPHAQTPPNTTNRVAEAEKQYDMAVRARAAKLELVRLQEKFKDDESVSWQIQGALSTMERHPGDERLLANIEKVIGRIQQHVTMQQRIDDLQNEVYRG